MEFGAAFVVVHPYSLTIAGCLFVPPLGHAVYWVVAGCCCTIASSMLGGRGCCSGRVVFLRADMGFRGLDNLLDELTAL